MKRPYLFGSAAIIVGVAAVAAAFAAGIRAGREQAKPEFAAVLASVQADLGLTKLQRLRELESDLARGCAKEALVKVKVDIDTQLLVLSSIAKDYKGTWVAVDLAKRDPKILDELESFKQQYQSWTESKCKA